MEQYWQYSQIQHSLQQGSSYQDSRWQSPISSHQEESCCTKMWWLRYQAPRCMDPFFLTRRRTKELRNGTDKILILSIDSGSATKRIRDYIQAKEDSHTCLRWISMLQLCSRPYRPRILDRRAEDCEEGAQRVWAEPEEEQEIDDRCARWG